jgi:competence protein ComEA
VSEKPEKTLKNNLLQYLLVFLFGIGLSGLILLLNKRPMPEMIQILPTPSKIPITIHITGEVNLPGVYKLADTARLQDLIELAGGFTENANESAINLASPVHDGQQIVVPSLTPQPPESPEESAVSKNLITYPININFCTLEELISLPGIGEAKANAIIQYREENGGFKVIEDILEVSGIGEATFESIKDKITVK